MYLNSYEGGVEIVLLQKLSLPVLSLSLSPSFQIMGITPKVKAFQRANVQSYNRGSIFLPLLLFDQRTGKEEVKCTVQDKDARWSAEQGLQNKLIETTDRTTREKGKNRNIFFLSARS